MTPLRTYRKSTGATLEELAGKVGVSTSQLSRIERHGTESLTRAVKIEEVTGVPAASLMAARKGLEVATEARRGAA